MRAHSFPLLAKIGVVAAIVTGLAGCSDSAEDGAATAPAGPVEIKPDDRFIGAADAPVTIVEYASMTCGACANFHATAFKRLKEEYIDTGKVRLVLREFPTPPQDRSIAAFMLARCFPEERFFGVVDALFRKQTDWVLADNSYLALKSIANQMGMSDEAVDVCLGNEAQKQRIDAVVDEGSRRYGISSTPSFVINGRTYQNMPFDEFKRILDPLVSR